MYYWQSYEQVQQEIKETCKAIRRHGEELRAKGPEACRQFLIDAGIIEGDKNGKGRRITTPTPNERDQVFTLPTSHRKSTT